MLKEEIMKKKNLIHKQKENQIKKKEEEPFIIQNFKPKKLPTFYEKILKEKKLKKNKDKKI